jgi:hypothetical protein
LERAVQLSPNVSRDTAFYLGMLKRAVGEPSEALKMFQAASEAKGVFFYQQQLEQQLSELAAASVTP